MNINLYNNPFSWFQITTENSRMNVIMMMMMVIIIIIIIMLHLVKPKIQHSCKTIYLEILFVSGSYL